MMMIFANCYTVLQYYIVREGCMYDKLVIETNLVPVKLIYKMILKSFYIFYF
jgi:hypothetical protein